LSGGLLDAIIVVYEYTVGINRLDVCGYRELILKAARGADDPAHALVQFEYYRYSILAAIWAKIL
jgi:hypothetical protein